MRQATTIHPAFRQQMGLLQLAQPSDYQNSFETDGSRTDHHRALASKIFNVPYDQVTDQQRKAAKKANFWMAYQ